MKRRNLCAGLLTALFSITNLSAQDSLVQLEQVTVTASLLAQEQRETGRNVTVVKGEWFRRLPVHSVDDLLRYLPGLEVQQRGPQGSQADILIRGGTFQQVLILIDGVRLNDPLTGHFNGYIPIQPAEIERVEILKGAASALYGSEAVGGVVNIITKTFHKQQEGPELRARLSAGEYQLINGEVYGRYQKGRTQVSGGILSNNTKGQPLRGTRGFFNLHSFSLAASRQLPKGWRAALRTGGDLRRFNAQNYYTTFASDTAREEVNSWWSQLHVEKKTEKSSLIADLAWKQLRDQYWFRPGAAPNDNRTKLFTGQFHYSYSVHPDHSFTTGMQVLQRVIRSNDRGNHNLWHGAVFGMFRHRLKPGWYLNESLRLDWDENYGFVLVPQVNMAWSPGKWTLRTSAGRSFRDADFTERYNNYNKTQVTSGRIGNPDLEAESSWNVEAGADYTLQPGLKISATLFHRWHRNLIDWTPTPYSQMPRTVNLVPNGSYALARNNERVNTSGAELDLVYQRKLAARTELLLTTGLTWLRSVNEDSLPSFYISSHARFLQNFSLSLSHRHFTFSATGLYKYRDPQKAAALGAAISSDYFLLNLRVGIQCPHRHGRLFIQADNVFDRRVSDLLGSPLPGRWLSGGIEIAL